MKSTKRGREWDKIRKKNERKLEQKNKGEAGCRGNKGWRKWLETEKWETHEEKGMWREEQVAAVRLTDRFPWKYTSHHLLYSSKKFDNMKETDFPEITSAQMDIYRPRTSPFWFSFYYLLSLIAEPLKISFVFIALPPWPFKQACDEYNDDGLDALYHHLVLVLYEIGCHITMKYSSALSIRPSALPL